jgi:hypothetical protein
MHAQMPRETLHPCWACRIEVNFSDEMTLLMREARALNRLGFAIPEAALHAVLQADHLLTIQESVTTMLADYNKASKDILISQTCKVG